MQKYKNFQKDLALRNNLSLREIEIIDRSQFEVLRYVAMPELKSLRLPNFGIFLIKERFKNETK